MTTTTMHLISSRNATTQRSHFALYIPNPTTTTTTTTKATTSTPETNDKNQSGIKTSRGTLIQAIGAPMAGYKLEIKHDFSPSENIRTYKICEIWGIGEIDGRGIVGGEVVGDEGREFGTVLRELERVAGLVDMPGISENFMAAVNETTNRRCQEWSMDYVRKLVALGYLDEMAIEIVQSKRDEPTYGIGLRRVEL